jgi:hypothetical protein
MKSLSTKLAMGIAGIGIMATAAIGADNLVKYGDADDATWAKKWHKNLSFNPQDKLKGKNSFEADKKYTWAFSPTMIEIDPAQAYKLSGWIKSIGAEDSRCFLGLRMYNAKKRSIDRVNITVRKGSFTRLMADAKKGDKVLKVSDCSKWDMRKLNLKRTCLAFDAVKDFSDLPNYNISPGIEKIEKKDNFYEVTLVKPLAKTYPDGTKIRQHYMHGGFQYCAASYKAVPKKWTQYSAVVKGLAKYGAPNKQFWPGTKYVRIVIILNYQKKGDCKALFDDISLVQVEEKKKK